MLKKKLRIFIFIVLSACSMAADTYGAQLKKTVAVSGFEDVASGGVVGSGMADQLAYALIQSGKFVVIERQILQNILAEQDLTIGGRAVASETAQKGKLLPAQILIRGAVTEFIADKQTGGTGISVSGISLGSNKIVAHVALILRLIDTTSGEILDSLRIGVEFQDKGSKMNFKLGMVDLSKEEFKKTPLGKATQTAINYAVSELIRRMEKIPFQARIIKIEGDRVYTNVGSRNGLDESTSFDVFAPGQQLVDPVTGENLGSEKTKVGRLRITSVQEKFSIGSAENGGPFKVGMILSTP